MNKRVIDISQASLRLNVRYQQLILRSGSEQVASIPLNEIATLVIANPMTSLSQPVISGVVEQGGAIIVCGTDYTPTGMMLPLQANFIQSERMRTQAAASKPTNKALWKQVVQAKVSAQAALLTVRWGSDGGLGALVARVRSGDPDNIEAQAAKKYWKLLGLQQDFRRNREHEDANSLLNYGYAVLRASVARAICAAGLHPSLGMHHHNRYNAFPLADDLMEPLRPLVDLKVIEIIEEYGPECRLDQESKSMLIDAVLERVLIKGEWRTLFDACAKTASSLVACYSGDEKRILLPNVPATLEQRGAGLLMKEEE